jgi:hypothetical protein
MTTIKFVVKLNRKGTLAPQYVSRMDGGPVQITANRKLALVMGKFAAEDAIKAMRNSRCNAELVTVTVTA